MSFRIVNVRDRMIRMFVPALIFVAVWAAYSNSIHGAFVLDDIRNIADNPPVRTLMPSRSSLLGPPWTTYTGRPVAMFTLACNYWLNALHIEEYHLFNILIHALATLTLWGLLRRTLKVSSLWGQFGKASD